MLGQADLQRILIQPREVPGSGPRRLVEGQHSKPWCPPPLMDTIPHHQHAAERSGQALTALPRGGIVER